MPTPDDIAHRIAAAMYPAPSDTARRDILREMLANELEGVPGLGAPPQTGGGDAGERAELLRFKEKFEEGRAVIDITRDEYNAALRSSHREVVFAFTEAILHGDEAHRKWLRDAATAFVDGCALPIPGE